MAAWPPLPLITALKKPFPANIGPDLEATSPKGKLFRTCNPNMAETFSKTPASKIFLAPPPPSSAGWKTRTTVPYTKNKEWYHGSIKGQKQKAKIIQKRKK
jgi:hypothetical protein